jgi:hypothetical protein
MMIVAAGIVIIVMFKLVIRGSIKKMNPEDEVLDKDGPNDRYLK